MLASLLIVFREVFEAGLVVGIVLAATQGMPRRAGWVMGGIAAGVGGAALLASFAGALSSALAGVGQEVFTASVLIVAVLMLGWHQIWMTSQSRETAREMKALGQAVALGQRSLLAMAVVIAVAVLREGAEVALFLYGIAESSRSGWAPILAGGLVGVALGALVAWLLYRGLVAIPVRRLFAVTSWLIALLAAGMAGQAAAILAGADIIPAWGYQLWDTSRLLPGDSLPGRALHALVGYADRPMGVQVAAYLAVLAALVIGARIVNRPPSNADRPPRLHGGTSRLLKGPSMHRLILAAAGAAVLASVHAAQAREFFVGGPVHVHDMEIVANYLVGIEMSPMPPGMAMGPDAVHLEADVHATADNPWGYPDGAWVPYLTIDYRIEKLGADWQASGRLLPMTAKDGPHYANNVKMDGPGKYKVTYRFTSPEANGFLRHTDRETGVPPWWTPFSQEFTFEYPQK